MGTMGKLSVQVQPTTGGMPSVIWRATSSTSPITAAAAGPAPAPSPKNMVSPTASPVT